MKIIPIFFTFDNNYVMPAAVAFYSLLNKARKNIAYRMYVLHSDITQENQKLLSDITGRFPDSTLEFIDTKGFLKDEWQNGNFDGHNKRNQFTRDAIVRCFAAKFFPQYDKIVYSDVDIVIQDDISELLDVDLEDKYFAGVKNPFSKWLPGELSHLKPEHYEMLKSSYIAGGIWVMNLKKIREDNLEQRMLEIINDETIIKRWPDKDIMNIACENKVGFLPLNYISYPYLLEVLQKQDFVSDYSREELFNSIISPKIIHYAAVKPWNNCSIDYAINWWTIFKYLNLPFVTKVKFVGKNILQERSKKYKKLYKLFLGLFIFALITELIIILIKI